MCYRSAKDGSKLATDGVWNDYTGVWHLGEKGNGKQTVLDSTTNDLDTVSHANSLAEVSGPVGAARRISTNPTFYVRLDGELFSRRNAA